METLEIQLAEMEMLASMYPEKGELEFDDPSAIADVRLALDQFADGSIPSSHLETVANIGFSLRLKTELQVNLNFVLNDNFICIL